MAFPDDPAVDEEQTPVAPRPLAPEPSDPYADIVRQMAEERDARLRQSVKATSATTPDRAADVRRLSERYQVAPDVAERNYDELKQRDVVDRAPIAKIQAETPKLAEWLATPANAQLVGDDLEPLYQLAKTLGRPGAFIQKQITKVARDISAGLNEGLSAALGSVDWATRVLAQETLSPAQRAARVGRPFNPAEMSTGGFGMLSSGRPRRTEAQTAAEAAPVKAMRVAMQEVAQVARGAADPDASGLENAIHSGFESVGMMIPGLAASIATGTPGPMLAILGTQTFGASYSKYDDAGVGFDKATTFALIDAAVEVGTEYFPAKWFFADVKKGAGVARIIWNQIGGEVPGELVASTAQSLTEFLALRPTEPLATWRDELPSVWRDTVVATITMVGVMGAVGKVMTSAGTPAGKAKQAERDQAFLDTLGKQAKAVKSIERSPAEMQALLTELGDDGVVYLPLAAFEAWAETATLDTPNGKVAGAAAIAGELTGQADAFERARRSGEDIEIPISAYAVQLAGTPHHTVLSGALRVNDPNQMTGEELKAYRAQILAEATEPLEEPPAATSSPVRQSTVAKIQGALLGSSINVPEGAADYYADIFEALTAGFKQEGLDPVETLRLYGFSVVGPKGQMATDQPQPFSERLEALRARKAAEAPAPTSTAPEAPGAPISEDEAEAARAAATDASLTPDGRAALDAQVAADDARRDARALVEPFERPAHLDPEAVKTGRALQERLAANKAPEAPAPKADTLDQRAAFDPGALADLLQGAPADFVPTAVYRGEQEDGIGGTVSLYDIVGGPRGRSTVGADTLRELGIPVPARPGDVPPVSPLEVAAASIRDTLRGTRSLYQGEIETTESAAPRFYSRLLRAVAFTPMQSGSGLKWKGVIAKWAKQKPTPTLGASWTEGINQMELALTSITDLDDGTIYTKQDVLTYLGTHQASVSEVIFGDPNKPVAGTANEDEETEWVQERAQELYDEAVSEDRDNAWENYESQLRYEAEEDTNTIEDPNDPDEEIEVTTWHIVAYRNRGRRRGQEEVERHDEAFDTEEDANDWLESRAGERWKEPLEESERDDFFDNYEGDASWGDAENAAQEEWDNDHEDGGGGRGGTDTHYEQYTIPRPARFEAGSYREAFVTAEGQQYLTPPIELKRATLERRYAAATQARIEAEQRYQAVLGTPAAVHPHLERDAFDKARNEEWSAQAALTALNRAPTSWKDGHQPYDNVKDPIARVRFATHIAIVPLEGAEAEANVEAIAALEAEQQQTVDQIAGVETQIDQAISKGADRHDLVPLMKTANELRSNRDEIQEEIDKLRASGRSVKMFFIEEIQPPQPDQQEKMTPIYREHWREIAFKWALNYASEHGYDGIAWTTGQQQVDRYPSIAQLVHSIGWKTLPRSGPDPLLVVEVDVKDRGQIKMLVNAKTGKLENAEGPGSTEEWVGRHLGQVISAEHAKTVLKGEAGTLTGDSLEIGGQGLRQTYDVDFVNVVNNLPALQRFRERKVIPNKKDPSKRPKVKFTGSLVGSFDIGAERASFHVEQSSDRVPDTRIRLFHVPTGADQRYFETRAEAEATMRGLEEAGYEPGTYAIDPPRRERAPMMLWRERRHHADELAGTFDTEEEWRAFLAAQPEAERGLFRVSGGHRLDQPMRNVTTYDVVRRSDRARTKIASFATAEEAAAELTRRQQAYDVPVLQPGIEFTPEMKQAVKSMSLFQDEDREPNLVIQHNTTPDKLRNAARLGGIPVPSLAIAKVDDTVVGFGEITLIGKKEMADPKGYAKPKVFGADIYSPRYPQVQFAPDTAALKRLNAILAPYRTAPTDPALQHRAGSREIYGAEITSPDDLAQRPEFLAWHKATAPATPDHFMVQRAAAAALLRQVGAKERIFMGFTDAGNRRYKAHTLDNVVAILKKDLRGGESDNNIYGIGQLRSKFTPQFRSVQGIIDAQARLISDEAFDAVKKETDEEFWAIVADLTPYSKRDAGFGFADTVMAVMADAATKGIPFALREYSDFGDVPLEVQQRMAGFMRNLRTMPTEYFEAKILREVDLAEFAGAVVPEGAPQDILDLLASRGVQVATYSDVNSRKAAVATFAKQLGEAVLFQTEPPPRVRGKRGSLTASEDDWTAGFGPLRAFTLQMFEGADVTTFTHETAHLFLKIMEDLAGRPEATARIKGDWAHLQRWFFGAAGQGIIGRAEHERFANAFNLYLSEGKSPSVRLRKVFEQFRTWFMNFTGELIRHDVKLTDDVRGVFDRMLATDAAIAEAQADTNATGMFTTPESARMSLAEFEVYQAKVAAAGLAARQKLERQLLRDLRKQQRRDYQEQKQAIRAQVEAEVHAMPVYRALSAMRDGTQPDGSPLAEDGSPAVPLTLSRSILLDRYGPDRLARLAPELHAGDGLDPDTVAELFGFSSGDALLTALATAPPMAGLITSATKTRMLAAHGDLVLDDKLSDLAKEAVANEHREAIVRIEMQTLGRLRRTAQAGAVKERDYERRWFEAEAKLRIAIAEGRKQVEVETARGIGKERLASLRAASRQKIDALEAEVQTLRGMARGGAARINASLPSQEDLRIIARDRIAQTRVRDIKPALFHAAARKAGQQAIDAAARQDFDTAIRAKQQEATSLALYREATRVVADLEARVKAAQVLDTPGSRKRVGLAGASYQAQIDAILDRYEFASITAKALDKRIALRAWIVELEKDGMAVSLPAAMIDDARRENYRELTADELVTVSDTLKGLVHLARLKNRFLKNQEARAFAIERDKLAASIRLHTPERPIPVAFRKRDVAARKVKSWFASHARIATLGQLLDGLQEGGPFWSAIIRPINEAASAKEQRNVSEGATYGAILTRHYPGRLLGTMHELMHIPALGPATDRNASLTLDERLAVAKNWGNETSRDRLSSDPKRQWSAAQIQAILDTLTANDLAYVQATFDFVNGFWPEIAAKTKRLTGVEPEKVEAVPIVAKNGTIRGGYYPLVADSRFSAKTRQWEKITEAAQLTSAAYVSSTTRRGHLETRVAHAEYSVKLEGGVIFNHLEQVIHDLTHHEMLIDVTRLLRDQKVADAIYETAGDVVYEQFTAALEAVAAGRLAGAQNGMDEAAQFMKTGTQIALLGYNVWTALQQPLGLFNGVDRIGARWVARGMGRWLTDTATLTSTVAWIHDVSPFMAGRSKSATQDLADLRKSLATAGGWFDQLVRTVTADRLTQQRILDSMLWHIGLMQRVADVPTWLGQYEKSMAAGESEARAIAIADQAIIDSQGSGRISDLSKIQRGGPVAQLYMTFYSYGATTYNASYRRAGRTSFKKPIQVAKFLGGLSLIYILPAMGTVILRELTRGGGDDDDDWAAWFEQVGRESIASALNGMVLVRELSQVAAEGTRGYAGPAGARALQMMNQFLDQAKQGELDDALLRKGLAVAGVVGRFPSAQVQRTIDGWMALQEDETDNPLALLFGPPRD